MKNPVAGMILIGLLLAVFAGAECATAGKAGVDQHPSSMRHGQGFIAIKGIRDGYSVIFHIMRAPQGAGYSRDEYHLMVSIEKEGRTLRGLAVKSTIRHPNGDIDFPENMVQLGDWYLARYNLNHDQGQHRISVDFRVGEKQYHAHIMYPEALPQ